MKKYIYFVFHIFIFFIAWLLIPFVTIISMICVKKSGYKVSKYFINTAKSIDIWANNEFRTTFNVTCLRSYSKNHFGADGETLSSVFGKNKLENSLSDFGKYLSKLIDFCDPTSKQHCIDAINEDINFQDEKFEKTWQKFHNRGIK